EQEAALALPARPLEGLAGLPQRDDAPHLLLRVGLAANVLEPHAPLGVARLVAADLRDPHEEQRAEQDRDVREQEPEGEEELRPDGAGAGSAPQAVPERARGAEPADGVALSELGEEDDADEGGDDDRRPGHAAPEPGSAAGEDVLLFEPAVVDAEEARPRDDA